MTFGNYCRGHARRGISKTRRVHGLLLKEKDTCAAHPLVNKTLTCLHLSRQDPCIGGDHAIDV